MTQGNEICSVTVRVDLLLKSFGVTSVTLLHGVVLQRRETSCRVYKESGTASACSHSDRCCEQGAGRPSAQRPEQNPEGARSLAPEYRARSRLGSGLLDQAWQVRPGARGGAGGSGFCLAALCVSHGRPGLPCPGDRALRAVSVRHTGWRMVGGSEGLPYSAGASLTGEGGPLRVLPAAPWGVMFRDALAAARYGAGARDGRRVGVGVGGVPALGLGGGGHDPEGR